MSEESEEQSDYAKQELARMEQETGIPATENLVELTKYILDPKKSKYAHITKDLAITTLTSPEIEYININLQLLHLLTYIEVKTTWDLEDLKMIIDADIKGFAQVTRSKGGFERLAEITKALKQYQHYEEKKDKGRWF